MENQWSKTVKNMVWAFIDQSTTVDHKLEYFLPRYHKIQLLIQKLHILKNSLKVKTGQKFIKTYSLQLVVQQFENLVEQVEQYLV